MPIGVIINTIAIFLGGIAGALLGNKLPEKYKEQLNLIFGLCSMGMGISSIVLMKYMPAVVFALIIGTIVGLVFNLGDKVYELCSKLQKVMIRIVPKKETNMSETEFLATLITVIVLFCSSGMGIYGSLSEGMTGDSSLLITKSILDFFTAAIFACNLGYIVSLIAVPQFVIFTTLFLSASFIVPLTTPDMIADFKACGGFLMVAAGFRILKLKMFPVVDMIPAMILVMPFSWFWVNIILHLL
jgi:integral membrane protein